MHARISLRSSCIGLLLLLPALALGNPTAFVINEASEDISVIDTTSNAVVATIGGLLSPVGITATADSTELLVTSYLDFVSCDGIIIFDAQSNLELGRVNTGVGFNTLQVEATEDGPSSTVLSTASVEIVYGNNRQRIDGPPRLLNSP